VASDDGLLEYDTTNAILAWALVAALVVVAGERLRSGAVLEAGFAAVVALVAVLPPVGASRPREMVAWEILAVAVFPFVLPYAGFLEGQWDYLAVAAVALLVAVELDAFTAVEMTPDFAVAFVVVVTMAVAGLWTIARFASDVYLGTSLLPGLNPLMWDVIAATAIGVLAGVTFELYARRVSPGRNLASEPGGEDAR